MTLWTSDDAVHATGGQTPCAWQATGVSIDTRSIRLGDLFVALTAARDGHDFVAQALEKGAAAALVSRRPDGVAPDAPLLIVEDVMDGLRALGQAGRQRMAGQVVAVTGSVGKTSTKEMLRRVLGGQGKVHAAEASYNNHWGVPLTLARMPADSDFAVIEIGMNHPGEIAPLAKLARPHVAVVTIVAPAHLEAFDDVAGIAREKAAIFDGLEPGGSAVLNGDLSTSPILRDAARAAASRVVDFGENAANAMVVSDVSVGDRTTVARLTSADQSVVFKVAVPGRHFAVNAAAVLAVVRLLDLDQAIALTDLGGWRPGAGRGQREVLHLDPADPTPRLELIDDAYNANPASLGAALEVLAAAPVRHDMGRISRGRRIAYLGDMKELGPTERDLHRSIAALPQMAGIDRVHCVGPLMHDLYLALPAEKRGDWTETSAQMAGMVARHLDAGDVVMAKGSLSMRLARVVDAVRKLGHPAPQSSNEDV